jgi:hypothetical protein
MEETRRWGLLEYVLSFHSTVTHAHVVQVKSGLAQMLKVYFSEHCHRIVSHVYDLVGRRHHGRRQR